VRTVADAADSGDTIRRPGGIFERGRRGEIEWRWSRLNRHGWGVRLGWKSGELKWGDHAVFGRKFRMEVEDADLA
jgi:hypothetical protein